MNALRDVLHLHAATHGIAMLCHARLSCPTLSFPSMRYLCTAATAAAVAGCGCRHLGAGGNRNTAVDVDYGGVSFEVTQLDGVLEI